MPKENETVLLVDDDELIGMMVKIILERNGYRVLVAKDSSDAIELNAQAKVDLVLADIVLPGGMNGPQLVENLQAANPGLRVIFSTGYNIDIVARDLELKPGSNLLQKPYETPSLLAMIRKVLDAK